LTSDINIDTNTQAVQLSTATATANFTINLRGDGSNSLDASMDNGESVTVAYINKNNNVTYYNTTVQVDEFSSNSSMARRCRPYWW
jgi:hypothetical protein